MWLSLHTLAPDLLAHTTVHLLAIVCRPLSAHFTIGPLHCQPTSPLACFHCPPPCLPSSTVHCPLTCHHTPSTVHVLAIVGRPLSACFTVGQPTIFSLAIVRLLAIVHHHHLPASPSTTIPLNILHHPPSAHLPNVYCLPTCHPPLPLSLSPSPSFVTLHLCGPHPLWLPPLPLSVADTVIPRLAALSLSPHHAMPPRPC